MGLRLVVAILAVLQVIAGVAAIFTLSAPEVVAAGVAPPAPLPEVELVPVEVVEPVVAPPPEPVYGPTDAADAVVPRVPLFEAPGAAAPFKTLTNPTFEKLPLVLHVVENRGDWLHVRVNTRPNGARAWIRSTDVKLRRVPNRIVIEVGARKLKVVNGSQVLAEHQVAVGASGTPTPIGEFYVDATVNLRGDGPYGVGQLSVSGFSEVLKTFGGGIGQIAIHGTNAPKSVGGATSNGCIRMLNPAWLQVSALAPTGTPVTIKP